MDANSKVGETVIENDPCSMTDNGRVLLDILERHDLLIVNATEKCKGLITRHRKLLLEKKKVYLTTLLSHKHSLILSHG